ncbi:uncharacterized protein [Anoplolepis gracilipes]
MPKYTIEEVALHSEDLWIIIHGNVYNLSTFVKEHPGGEEVLMELAGKDGTKCFDNIGHSDEAKQLREKFKIGKVRNRTQSIKSQDIYEETTSAEENANAEEKASAEESDESITCTEHRDEYKKQETKHKSSSMFAYLTAAVFGIMFYYYNKYYYNNE